MKQRIHGYFQLLSNVKNVNSNEWIKLTKLMKQCNYEMDKNELKQYSINTSKLISKCNHNMKQIQYIHSLIKDKYDNDIYIKTALINGYGLHSNYMTSAIVVFNSIKETDKDAVIIGCMMKIFMKNNQNDKALKLYYTYNTIADDTTHLLAIKACINMNDFNKGIEIHNNIRTNNSIFIKTVLIDFYGKFGHIELALNEFNLIRKKNTICLNAMLTAYVNNEQNTQAIKLYHKYESLHDDVSHILSLKACSNSKDISNWYDGKRIHSKIMKLNKPFIVELDNTLMDFHGTFGDEQSALNIFNQMSTTKRNTVSVNCIMNVLLINKMNNEALLIYDQFTSLRNHLSNVLAIKACINLKQFERGQQIFNNVYLSNQSSIRLKNTMIDFYGSFGKINEAENIFNSMVMEDMKNDDVITINSMMTAYVNNGEYDKACKLYDNSTIQDDVSHTLAIKALIGLNALDKVHEICEQLGRRNNDLSLELKHILIDFYGRCGTISNAEKYFDLIPDTLKNDVTINTMMKAYTDNGHYNNSLAVYDKYTSLHDGISHMEAIKACIVGNQFAKGKTIYATIKDRYQSVQLRNALIDFYGYFGDTIKAFDIFNSMGNEKDVISVNSMMKALINNDNSLNALTLYDEYEAIHNNISHLLAIKACTNLQNLDKGITIHNKIPSNDEINLQTALIDFYGTLKLVDKAHEIFNSISCDKLNIVAINCMMTAFINNGYNQEALSLYDKYDTLHDDISHLLAIKVCTNTDNKNKGMDICNIIGLDVKNQIIPQSISQELKVTLIDFFGNQGDIKLCIHLFDSIADDKKDIICINAIMEAYCDCNMNAESIELFQQINKINDRILADYVTYSIFFKACTQGTLFHIGCEMYCSLKSQRSPILKDLSVQINLINMFGKFGMMGMCEEIFNSIKNNEHEKYITELSIWNAMIKSYGRNGELNQVKKIWNLLKQQKESINPSLSTYIILIHAFSHCGAATLADTVWSTEIVDNDIKYDGFMIASLADCFSRNGRLVVAELLIYDYEDFILGHSEKSINITCYRAMWMSLLFGCRKYVDMKMANHVYQEMQKRFNDEEEYMAAAATLLANIYAAEHLNEEEVIDTTLKKEI